MRPTFACVPCRSFSHASLHRIQSIDDLQIRMISSMYWSLTSTVLIAVALLCLHCIVPINDSKPNIADDTMLAQFPKDFIFGIATAPAHVEDHLNDTWLQWAQDGNIPGWNQTLAPTQRLKFWTRPEIDIELARSTGVKMFRLGVDWGRLAPYEPGTKRCDVFGYYHQTGAALVFPCRDGVQDIMAMDRYVEIFKMILANEMQISLTLFHHSLPVWASSDKRYGGWTNPRIVQHFISFVQDVIPRTAALVDHYVTLNEPSVFCNLVYGVSMWPGRFQDYPDYWRAYWDIGFLQGRVIRAYIHMAEAHIKAYEVIKRLDSVRSNPNSPHPALVGIAHNTALYQSTSPVSVPIASFMHYLMNLEFMYRICEHIDYIGMNYYGTEYVSLTGMEVDSAREYSESGRAIHPNGMYQLITELHKRFNVQMGRSLPIYILENGISDETDILRPSYLIEHLLAAQKAMSDGVPIRAFVFWTISDNWEWADGYCPKFGIFGVDRSSPDLVRIERPSVNLIRTLAKTGTIMHSSRMKAFNQVRRNLRTKRPFCRLKDGQGTVDKFTQRDVKWHDWLLTYRLDLVPARPWWEWFFPQWVAENK